MFDVDVTTEDNLKLGKGVGMRVCIGGSNTDWYKTSATGVSYVGSFGAKANGAGIGTANEVAPAFVFAGTASNIPRVSAALCAQRLARGLLSWVVAMHLSTCSPTHSPTLIMPTENLEHGYP